MARDRKVHKTRRRSQRVSSRGKAVARPRRRTPGRKLYEMRKDIDYKSDPSQDFLVLTNRYFYEREFSKAVKKEIKKYKDFEFKIIDGRRRDLTDDFIITIDGDDAKDFDDAVSVSQEDGKFRLGVHIADVSYFVKQGSELDRAAHERGTSVYLVNRVIPMLPERLSNDLCSLVEGKKRFTLSCSMLVDHEGKIVYYEFFPSVIKSRKRCTYKMIEKIIRGDHSEGREFDEHIKLLAKLREVFYKKRIREGSVDFESDEIFMDERRDGTIATAMIKERLSSERLIEECMLAANRCAADLMLSGGSGIYRVHESPKEEKLMMFNAMLKRKGYNLSRGTLNPLKETGKNVYQVFLDSIRDENHKRLFSHMLLTALNQARYSEECLGHWGLGFHRYTHFTSPIRRYPDLVAHRLIKKILRDGAAGNVYSKLELTSIASRSSINERKAVDAEREYYKIKSVRYMSGHLGREFDMIISGVRDKGIFVRDTRTGIEGFIDRERFHEVLDYDEEQGAFVSSRQKTVFEPGMFIKCRLLDVNYRRLFIDFDIV